MAAAVPLAAEARVVVAPVAEGLSVGELAAAWWAAGSWVVALSAVAVPAAGSIPVAD